jgi:hypothetical protein
MGQLDLETSCSVNGNSHYPARFILAVCVLNAQAIHLALYGGQLLVKCNTLAEKGFRSVRLQLETPTPSEAAT